MKHASSKLFKQSLAGLVLVALLMVADAASAYTADKVWFEFREGGIFRVVVQYTVPDLKEFRESYVDFTKKKDAETFYFNLIKGADFFPDDPKESQFVSQPLAPDPW